MQEIKQKEPAAVSCRFSCLYLFPIWDTVEQELCGDKNKIYDECYISKIEVPYDGNTIGNRDNG